ncbi:MAG: dihydrodipicolinate synthase family protein, partial [Bacteroidetes bacterium]|nr:dihydrodipicolinate synthase family protein [Bacteroidota bacterium]
MIRKKLTGTGVALITPFRKDGSIDFRAFEKLLDHVISGGVDYLVLIGITSESPTLTCDERNAVISYAVEICNKRVPVVVGAGGNNTQAVLNLI